MAATVEEKDPPVAENATAVVAVAYSARVPPANTVAVCAVPDEESLASSPFDVAEVPAPTSA